MGKREGTLNNGRRGETRHNLTHAHEEISVKGNPCSKHSPCFPTSIKKQANKAKVLSAAELRFSFFFFLAELQLTDDVTWVSGAQRSNGTLCPTLCSRGQPSAPLTPRPYSLPDPKSAAPILHPPPPPLGQPPVCSLSLWICFRFLSFRFHISGVTWYMEERF